MTTSFVKQIHWKWTKLDKDYGKKIIDMVPYEIKRKKVASWKIKKVEMISEN